MGEKQFPKENLEETRKIKQYIKMHVVDDLIFKEKNR